MKTFAAAALLAVFATAQEDSGYWGTGVSRFNGIDGVLVVVSETTSLNYKYYFGGNESTDEFHGDFTLAFPDTDMWPDIEYGFCFLVGVDAGLWDCMRVRTNIDLEALAGETNELTYDTVQQFQVADVHSANNTFPAGFGSFLYSQPGQLNDDDNVEDQSSQNINWRLSPSKSFKSGCVAGEEEGKVRCDWINAHWFRNFETLQKTQDIQLDVQAADQLYTAYGWIAQYENGFTDFDPAVNLVAATPNGEGIEIYPNAAKAAREALTEAEKIEIQNWEASLNPRNGEELPVDSETEDEDETDDGEETADEGEETAGEEEVEGDGDETEATDDEETADEGEETDGEGDGEDDGEGDNEEGDGEGDNEEGDGEGDNEEETGGDEEGEGDENEGEGNVEEVDEEVDDDGAAEIMTYAAAMVTAFGALLI